MKCSQCNLAAIVLCGCNKKCLCQVHLASHLLEAGDHPIESLTITLEESKLKKLKSEALNKLEKIDKAIKDITSKTFSLIDFINKEYNQSMKRLEEISEVLISFITNNVFSKSEVSKIEEIGFGLVTMKEISFANITKNIKDIFIQDVATFVHPEKSKIDAMDLRKRIDYFHPLGVLPWNLNNCYNNVSAIHISKDGKLLFVFWRDPNYGNYQSNLTLWDMKTKKLINQWQPGGNPNDENDLNQKELKDLKTKYPECFSGQAGI